MKTQRFVCSPSGVCVHPVGSGEATERTELLGRGGGAPRQLPQDSWGGSALHYQPGREFSSSWELIEVCTMGACVCCVFVLLQEPRSNFIRRPLVMRCL